MNNEILRRRTFAIISHPDAGKTTLTEKLLLFGGQIQVAGAVKSNKIKKTATSDWMEIEKQRGISVTTSVMEFDYEGYKINILDTPGHQDFAEDTFRTLTAVDSVIIVVDSAKGVEAQTRKLMEVCRMRNTPVIIFANKMDREGKDPFELLDELEEELHIKVRPLSWPIDQGQRFKGVYNIYENKLDLYTPSKQVVTEKIEVDIDSSELEQHIGEEQAGKLRADLELISGVYPEFNVDEYLQANIAPVFFGSALTNFGVQTFLETFLQFAPAPHAHKTVEGELLDPMTEEFSGFVFKIQANMNPAHRDRIAFVRICSGTFERGMDVTLQRTGKKMKLSNVTQFMADTRENIEEAVAGDIIGVYDTGNYQIGDTLTEGKLKVQFEELPSFTPEIFMRVTAKNVMKQKSFHKGIYQLVQEGAIQLYKTYLTDEYIIGAVGQLQFEVFQYRMKNEYNAEVVMTPMGNKIARWIKPEDLDEKMSSSRNILAKDRFDQPLFLFENEFAMRWFADKYPNVELKSLL